LTQNTHDRALSHVQATLLLIALTVTLAAMVLLLFRLPFFTLYGPPAIIKIDRVESFDETGKLNYDSRVTLVNTGDASYDNAELKAYFYRNGDQISSVITTMNGARFIATHHRGIQTLGGTGSQGKKWDPRERVCIDFTDRTFHPADLIRVDIIDNRSGQVISRHSRVA
jgi:flagellin-like protein